MTLLHSFICRLGGHKPYEFPRLMWTPLPRALLMDGQMMIVKRCKRCGIEISRRPMRPEDEQIEA